MRVYIVILMVVSLLGLCAGCGPDRYARQTYQQNRNIDGLLTASIAPREGWATDPHLSYNLFSYYPLDYQLPGIYGHYGYAGIYFH